VKVLVIGNGGREHALAWKCAAAPRVTEVLVAPGNAGTAAEPKVRNVAVGATDIPGLVALARRERVDLTIVGPEGPLVLGVVDAFEAAGLACFGPRRAPAQLEGSKAFTKAFLERHGIPTAAYRTFTRANFDADWVRAQSAPVVVKASGLAAGKGVVICASTAEAIDVACSMFDGRFGDAGAEVVIEEFLDGEEASFIVMADGRHALPFATSQDHKRVGDGGLAAEGMPYTGFLYAGLMIMRDGAPRVIEFNCRFGDPEAQPVMSRLQSDLTALCEAALAGRLDQAAAQWDPRAALGVVIAAAGYPDSPRTGDAIDGLAAAARLPGKVFHAGTKLEHGRIVTSGGRVLCAVGLGERVADAQRQAYALVDAIHIDGAHCRRDIGHRAIARGA
jgi:phosphoribosylamine--glycine ligase